MGFLNNTTVTVDAILTKKGRELLAQGTEAFNITKFALSDDEVDYGLWDVTHPNGSDYYGKAIENMPLLEAFTDESQVMRYKLVTLPKTTSNMPQLSLNISSITFEAQGGTQSGIPNVGTPIIPESANDSSFTFILHNDKVASLETDTSLSATTPLFIAALDSDSSVSKIGTTCNVKAVQTSLNRVLSTQLTIVGNDTGATKSIVVTNRCTQALINAAQLNQNQSN